MPVCIIDELPFHENTRKKLHYLVEFALSNLNDIVGIVLFGSYARGEQNMRSDIDLCILTDGEFTRLQRGTIAAEYDEYNADVVIFPRDEFFNSDSRLVYQIKRDGVVLWRN